MEIAGQQQSIDLFIQAQIDDLHEGAPRRIVDQLGKIGVAQRQRPQWRVEMDIRRVDEAISQRSCPLKSPEPAG